MSVLEDEWELELLGSGSVPCGAVRRVGNAAARAPLARGLGGRPGIRVASTRTRRSRRQPAPARLSATR